VRRTNFPSDVTDLQQRELAQCSPKKTKRAWFCFRVSFGEIVELAQKPSAIQSGKASNKRDRPPPHPEKIMRQSAEINGAGRPANLTIRVCQFSGASALCAPP